MKALNVRVNAEITDEIDQLISRTGLHKSVVLRHIIAQGLLSVEKEKAVRHDDKFCLHVKKNQTLSDFE